MQEIELYSYHCGIIDFLNEMLRAGVKRLALSRPLEDTALRDALVPFAQDACRRYGTKHYIEDEPLLCDLFPVSMNQGRYNILFYMEDHILNQYLRLKERKAALVAERAYFGGNRNQLAVEFGRLLSYPPEVVKRMVAENTDKEQF